ncbi:MAG TPA: hypothetical protein VF033_00310 [Steroidobacteraceae bacterium]|jgi:hypothetical protein
MKSLIKFAVGAAIAGALINLLLKQQRSRATTEEDRVFDDTVGLRGDEPVEVEILTVATGVAPEDGEAREDWYGSQIGDAPRH